MVISDPKLQRPTSEELLCSDDTSVDNENQNFLPNLLLFILKFIWEKRSDWFFWWIWAFIILQELVTWFRLSRTDF